MEPFEKADIFRLGLVVEMVLIAIRIDVKMSFALPFGIVDRRAATGRGRAVRTVSSRNLSTPRSSQNRTASSSSNCMPYYWKLRSGWDARELCRQHCFRTEPYFQAGPPKIDIELLGAAPSGSGSAQTYQLALSLVLLARLSINQGCWSDVCEST